MDLDGLERLTREWVDDETGEQLWTSEAIRRFADEAHTEALIRTRLLVESNRPGICQIPLVIGQRQYKLHSSVIVVRRAEYVPAQTGARPEPLRRRTFDAMDTTDRHWTSHTGRPEAIIQDLQRRELWLDKTPIAAQLGTLHLTVWRRPLEAERLEQGGDEPLIPEEDHSFLAHWICYRLYLRKDAETNDRTMAEQHRMQFEAHFGPRPTAAQIRALATDDAGDVACYHY